MNNYQIQYKYNTKTHTINLSAESWQHARDFALDLINGEITEIREFVHKDDTKKVDDKDYVHSKSLLLKNETGVHSLRIPKIKKSVDDNMVQSLVFSHLKLNSKKPNSVKITSNF